MLIHRLTFLIYLPTTHLATSPSASAVQSKANLLLPHPPGRPSCISSPRVSWIWNSSIPPDAFTLSSLFFFPFHLLSFGELGRVINLVMMIIKIMIITILILNTVFLNSVVNIASHLFLKLIKHFCVYPSTE